MTFQKTIWTRDRVSALETMHGHGYTPAEIAQVLFLTEQQVRDRMCNASMTQRAISRRREVADILDARDRALAQPRTLTARVCGDPLPGRSALDKMRQERRA